MNDKQELLGVFEKTLYRNEFSGFTIFSIKPQLTANIAEKMSNGIVKCKANIPLYQTGIPLKLTGTWEVSEYGWTFQCFDIEENSFDKICALDYLKTIKGIGDQKAEKLLEEFSNDNIFDAVSKPGANVRIKSAVGCSLTMADGIANNIRSSTVKRELMKFIFRYGGKLKTVNILYNKYAAEALENLQQYPYTVGYKAGLSLECCDKIAVDFSKDKDNPLNDDRVNAYVVDFMVQSKMSGNVYEFERDLLPEVTKKMNNNIYGKDVNTIILSRALSEKGLFVQKRDNDIRQLFLKQLDKAENQLAKEIFRLQTSSVKTTYEEKYREKAEEMAGFEFAPEQRSAFNLLKQTGIGILTGGPGTGKTTTVKGIIDAYEMMYPDNIIKCCAPTGRAAQRMTESTGRPSTTIHRLLEYKPFNEGEEGEVQCKSAKDPIEADFIIVDEVSMLDCELASLFFAAVKAGSLVIMVGDINQLQSVGPGDVLNDLIRSGYIPVERLIKTYRQSADSYIISNANKVNQGYELLKEGSDFEIFQTENVTDKIKEIVQEFHQKDDLFYCQILSPTHKGDGGVADVNYQLQELLNKENKNKKLAYGKTNFYLNDKIIMMKNNLKKGYCNGDVGVITDIQNDKVIVNIQDQEIVLDQTDLDDMSLAYAMTIHKSQGSEFPVVIIALPQSGMLKRNLLYTAITRAKKKVIIVEQKGAIANAVKRNEVGKRRTNLVQRMDALFKEEFYGKL